MGKPKYGRFRQKLVWKMLYSLLFSQGHEKKMLNNFFRQMETQISTVGMTWGLP